MEAVRPSPHHDELRRRKEAEYLAGYCISFSSVSPHTKQSANESSGIPVQHPDGLSPAADSSPADGSNDFATQGLALVYSSIQNSPDNNLYATQSSNFPIQSASSSPDYTIPATDNFPLQSTAELPSLYFPIQSVASSSNIPTTSLPYFPLQTAPATTLNSIYATAASPAQAATATSTTLQAYTAPAQPMSNSSKPAEFMGGSPIKSTPMTAIYVLLTLAALYSFLCWVDNMDHSSLVFCDQWAWGSGGASLPLPRCLSNCWILVPSVSDFEKGCFGSLNDCYTGCSPAQLLVDLGTYVLGNQVRNNLKFLLYSDERILKRLCTPLKIRTPVLV